MRMCEHIKIYFKKPDCNRGNFCYCSVPQLCVTLCNPRDYSMPGFPVLHYLSFPILQSVVPSLILTCFFTCIQVSQEAGKRGSSVAISLRILQFAVIHTVKGFCVASEAEVDVFLKVSRFFYHPMYVGNLIRFLCLF